MELLYERDLFEPPQGRDGARAERARKTKPARRAPEYTCEPLNLQPIEIPDGCAEVIEFARYKFMTRRQWSYLKIYIELCELPCTSN